MLKLNLLNAALLAALCAPAFAQTEAVPSETDDIVVSLQAAAPVTSAATLVKAAPTVAENRARSYQGWLTKLGTPYANQLGTGNGDGVTVGVVDSGLQLTHPTLKGQVLATYNAFTGGTDVTDQIGHGTHVSGLIAGSLANGSLTQGVAPGAKLVMAKVFQTGSADSLIIQRGIDWTVNVQKAPIVSLSLGSNALSLQTPIQNAVTKGTLITAALGNDGFTNRASWPAEFAKATWAKGQIIAVGAVDANNKRASFSNVDPTLANWTVYAPGVNVASSYSVPSMQNAYVYMSGTSMATPIVAGQAALIKSNWNFLTAPDLAQVIFQSATRLCSTALTAAACAARTTADPVYGWGVVNIGASLQPIGSLNVGTRTGTVVNFAGTALASAKGGKASGLKGVNATAVDKFNRGFVVNLATTATGTAGTGTAIPAATSTTAATKGVNFSAEYSQIGNPADHPSATDSAAPLKLARMSYRFADDRGAGFGFGTGGTAGQYFGLDATGSTPLNLGSESSRFNAPYFAMAESATHLGYSSTLDDGIVLRWGVMTQAASSPATLADQSAPVAARSLATVELQKQMGNMTGVLTLGQLQETNSVLGLAGSGALALQAQGRTTFMTLAGSLPVAPKTTLSAMATLGLTAGYDNSAASLIEGASGSQTAAWSLGLARKDIWRNGDTLGLTLAMPLKTISGSLQVYSAVSQSQVDGSLQYASQAASLAPSGTERDLELSYATPLRIGGKLSVLSQLRLQPGHDAEAPTQFGLGLRYVRALK
ncbi:MAG: S8 family serine peptidase [Burkholderiales bacterium]|nr:S8 family serine peptidase [Burkholderiales bacterium]